MNRAVLIDYPGNPNPTAVDKLESALSVWVPSELATAQGPQALAHEMRKNLSGTDRADCNDYLVVRLAETDNRYRKIQIIETLVALNEPFAGTVDVLSEPLSEASIAGLKQELQSTFEDVRYAAITGLSKLVTDDKPFLGSLRVTLSSRNSDPDKIAPPSQDVDRDLELAQAILRMDKNDDLARAVFRARLLQLEGYPRQDLAIEVLRTHTRDAEHALDALQTEALQDGPTGRQAYTHLMNFVRSRDIAPALKLHREPFLNILEVVAAHHPNERDRFDVKQFLSTLSTPWLTVKSG